MSNVVFRLTLNTLFMTSKVGAANCVNRVKDPCNFKEGTVNLRALEDLNLML